MQILHIKAYHSSQISGRHSSMVNINHNILKTAFFCYAHLCIFLGNLPLKITKYIFMKLTSNTCFSLKFFKIFDKTIIDTKRLHKDK